MDRQTVEDSHANKGALGKRACLHSHTDEAADLIQGGWCGINPQRKDVYRQDLKRVQVSVVRIWKKGKERVGW